MKDFNFDLKIIEISKIKVNPDNPRGKDVRANDTRFEYLKRSIKELGLMVPLVVKKINEEEKDYMLLDGERRYYALKELGKRTAPAHILLNDIDAREAKNLVFHIHTNRVNWDAIQQCRALEPLYKKLKNNYKDNERKIITELIRSTGTEKRTAENRIRFFRWPKELRDKVYSGENPSNLYWTVVEIEAGIIEPGKKNFPEYFEKVSVNDVRKFLLNKYLSGLINKGTEVRKVAPIVRTTKDNIEQYEYAQKMLSRLIEEEELTFEDAKEEFISKFPEAGKIPIVSYKKVINSLLKLVGILKDCDTSFLMTLSRKQRNNIEETASELEEAISNFKKYFEIDSDNNS